MQNASDVNQKLRQSLESRKRRHKKSCKHSERKDKKLEMEDLDLQMKSLSSQFQDAKS